MLIRRVSKCVVCVSKFYVRDFYIYLHDNITLKDRNLSLSFYNTLCTYL